MAQLKLAAHKGFTLIELVTVIVVLGIVSIGISGFLRSGFQIYADGNERQLLLSESRFVAERLSREIRGAIPNSARVKYDAALQIQCLEFVPAEWVSFYTTLPIYPGTSTKARIVEFPAASQFSWQPGDYAFVYPTTESDIYDYDPSRPKRQTVLACSDAVDADGNHDGGGDCATADSSSHTAELTLSGSFADHSPASRMYFGRRTVSYCARTDGGTKGIYRYEDVNGINNIEQPLYTAGGDLMAQHLNNDLSDASQLPFSVSGPVLNRNGLVHLLLAFEFNDEKMDYSIEVHIPNVP